MKKRIACFVLSLVLCAGLAVPALAAEKTFSDVAAEHWAYTQINQAVSDGIVGGYADGTFRPSAPVSYGAFSLMLARAFYPNELASYSDKGTSTGEVIMNNHKIFDDTSRKSSSIGAAMPREDMAQMLYMLLVDTGAAIPADTEYTKAVGSISDLYDINPNCRRGVMICYTLGLLNGQGDGSFGPKNSMNRAQACVVIGRLQDHIGDLDETTPVSARPGATLANGKPVTEENVLELLAELKEKYPHLSTYDPYNPPYYSRAFGVSGTACAKLALMLSDEIFGNLPVRTHTDISQIRPGDVVEYKGGTHWNVAIAPVKEKASGDGYCYWSVDGGSAGEVFWSDPTSGTCQYMYQKDGYTIYTRYPD